MYIYSQKALWDVPSAYCSKRRIRMRACHAHVLNLHLLFFYLSRLSVCPSKGFSKAFATDDFDLLIFRLVYIFIMNGELLVPSPVTLVVDLRKIEGRTPPALTTLRLPKLPLLPFTFQTLALLPLKLLGDKDLHQTNGPKHNIARTLNSIIPTINQFT